MDQGDRYALVHWHVKLNSDLLPITHMLLYKRKHLKENNKSSAGKGPVEGLNGDFQEKEAL